MKFLLLGIATITGFVGLLSSALLITVLAQKLLLTRREKYVHTFVLNTVLAKERQHHAANVVKYAIHIWFLKRKPKTKFLQSIRAQRKLYGSIACLQEVKQQQKNLINNCVGLHELMAVQQNMNMQYDESVEQMMQMKNDGRKVEEKLNIMAQSIDNLQTSVNILLDNLSK
jgi:macrodomain Ter protein organizer (MatP/YcbG family)